MTRKKKIWLIILVVLLSLILIGIGIGWYFINNFEKKAYSFVVEEVEKATGGLYHIDMDDLEIRLSDQTIRLENIRFHHDTAVLQSMKQNNSNPGFIYNINVKRIDVKVNHIIRSLINNKYKIEYFDIFNPEVNVTKYNNINEDRDSTQHKEDKSLLPSSIHGLTLNQININNGDLYFYVREEKDTIEYSIENFNFNIKKLVLDSLTDINKALPDFEKFELSVGKFKHDFSDYSIEVNSIKLNLEDSLLHIDTLKFIPRYKKYDFAYVTRRPGRVNFTCENIDMVNFDFESFAYDNYLKTDSIYIGNVLVSSYKNKNIPPTSKIKPLFHHYVQEVGIKMTVPVIEIAEGYVYHEELAEKAQRSGYIEFEDLSAKIKGLTNIVTDKDEYYTFEGKGKFMSSSDVKITFLFPVDSTNQKFNITGQITGLDLKKVNNILEAASPLSVETGYVSNAYFNMNGNNTTASVDMLMLYANLRINLMKDDGSKRVILSELANDLLLESDNPKSGQQPREVRGFVKRNFYLTEFNFLWLALMEGIKQSVGINENRQNRINNLQKQAQEIKLDKQSIDSRREAAEEKRRIREQNRIERQERRAQRRAERNNNRTTPVK